MKLLLDENLPHALRTRLPGHDVFTAQFMGWRGIKNGQLLALAAANGFDALITVDTGIRYQQNLAALPCSVVIIKSESNAIEHIEPVIPALLRALTHLPPNSVTQVK